MRIGHARLHFLSIPLKFSFSHGARTGRTASDSVVLSLEAGGSVGYGEAVVREYVSGSLGIGETFRRESARLAGELIERFRDRDLSWPEIRTVLLDLPCEERSLPLLCALEAALLDCSCHLGGGDAYRLMGTEPAREHMVYSAVLPILPIQLAERYLSKYVEIGFQHYKVKVASDRSYNDAVLASCRRLAGSSCEVRVDANSSWKPHELDLDLDVCERYGVRLIEQPFPVSSPGAASATRAAQARGFHFMADEGVLTAQDVASIARSGLYQMLNLRLSKNGGLLRVLSLARDAEASGLPYQLGCMVGETGILSGYGRLAASLLPNPAYLEGGYDEGLLTENVTRSTFPFRSGGIVDVVRGKRAGYDVDAERLARLSVAVVAV